ncbi:MAG: CatA-like O-acetyltransferase, family 3 [Oscillospiraceae bacterium]|jgi:chloramphenicol O-acetyltransferase type A|nr:CatA-like O-acetyltransferase, family 3 [Oscillospiraceae bacterium]
MNYHNIDLDSYYRKGVFRHFSEDCKCSVSMTSRVDVTELYAYSKKTGTKFYINFLYLLTKALNSREDYRMQYLYQSKELIVYDKINPTHYVFHEDTETCTPVYTEYDSDYQIFYKNCEQDIAAAKQSSGYHLDSENHPNWFDASYVSWLSYDELNIELPDGYLYFMPIINWGRYRQENGRLMLPLTVRMNHAAADGYLVAKVYLLLADEIRRFVSQEEIQ